MWFQIKLPYACFGVKVLFGHVIEAAPIGAWMVAKDWNVVKAWIRRKGGSWEPI